MRQINDTTFIADTLGDLKPVVTIGGKPVDKFIPNLNMSFHDDEFFINLNRRDKQAINATDKAEIDGIDKDIFYIDENGRFKWDIEFKERPVCNSWTWELKHAEGIEFYYQGELTDEEIKDGCERPIEVVGSYAVYCNQANNKYKTGKLCHIYRPFCYDINVESIYADLKIADGKLTITIDETWLNNAVYPVRLDPTFGYTTQGSSWRQSTKSTNPRCCIYDQYISSGIETIELISVYAYGNSKTIQTAPYTVSEGLPSSRLDNANDIIISSSAGWYTTSGLSTLLSNEITYTLAVSFQDTGTTGVYIGYDTATNGACNHNSTGALPATWTFGAYENRRLSIYATYTASGGSSIPTIINNYRQQGVM